MHQKIVIVIVAINGLALGMNISNSILLPKSYTRLGFAILNSLVILSYLIMA